MWSNHRQSGNYNLLPSVIPLTLFLVLTLLAGSAVLAATQTYSNTTSVTFSTSGQPTPTSTSITVTGAGTYVSDVNVTLSSLTHSFPDDIDILLVGPGGENVILMSDTGGGNGISNINLTLDDSAASSLPNSTQITSGTYKPTDFTSGDTFTSPAPSGPYGATLSVFNGTDPNGTWTLHFADDVSGDSGSMSGWSLEITTSEIPTADDQSVTTTSNTPLEITLTGSDPNSDPLKFSIDTPPTHGSLGTLDADTGVVTYTPAANYVGPDSFIFTVDDLNSGTDNGTVSITVTDSNVITSAPTVNVAPGDPVTHTFTATGDPTPTLSYTDENLPPGITRTGDTLSGTTTTTGTFGITVTASNSVAPDAVQHFQLIIGADSPLPPPPPPTPLCDAHNFSDGGVVRSSIADSMGYALNCRVLYTDGAPTQWLGGDLYNAGSIGIEGILNLGVLQAIDIFSPSGITYFQGGGVFCLKGEGTLIWLAASGMPRHAEIIGSYTVPEFPGFTCATLFEPGTLVLVAQNPLS